MSRIHAFGDDALGDLDAVGLVEKLRAREVAPHELVEAAIARTEAADLTLNGLAFEAFDRARARADARRPYGGYFDGVPSFIKDNVAVEGMPTMQGTDAWDPRPMPSDGEFARAFLATGLIPLGKTQMSEFGFSGSAEHPPIGDVTQPGTQRLRIAFCTKSILREASPEVRELTLKTAALLEELGHTVTEIDNPVPDRFKDDFLVYWSFLAFAIVRGGRGMYGPSFDRTRLDGLTLGLDRKAARNLYRVPAAIARLSATRRITQRLSGTYDAVLMPTLNEETPRIGHFDPTAGYDQVMDRLLEWVAFTPLQYDNTG